MRHSEVDLLAEPASAADRRRRAPIARSPVTKVLRPIVGVAAVGVLAWQLGVAGRAMALSPPARVLLLVGVTYLLGWGAYFVLGRGSVRGRLANCAVTTASILFCWALVELPALLGIVDYRLLLLPTGGGMMTRLKPWDDPRNQFDRELMYTRRPGERIVGETTGDLVYWLGISTAQRYRVDAQYDGHGFRNDHAIDAAPVALIGDSFLEAGLVPHAAILSTRLSQLLKVEVANLGMGGYGPQQELAVLGRYAMPLHPKLVIWFFFEGNDLLDVPRYEMFARDADAHLRELYSFRNRSFTKQALGVLAHATAPGSTGDATEARRRSCRLRSGASPEANTIYFGYGAQPLSPKELTSFNVVKTTLLEAQRVTAASGATLMLAYVPTNFRVYGDFCDPPEDGYARTWIPNDLPQRLQQWSAAHSIAFLDLTGALRDRAAHGELVYFPDDGHWNEAGNAVAADTIADAIAAHGWLSAPQ